MHVTEAIRGIFKKLERFRNPDFEEYAERGEKKETYLAFVVRIYIFVQVIFQYLLLVIRISGRQRTKRTQGSGRRKTKRTQGSGRQRTRRTQISSAGKKAD